MTNTPTNAPGRGFKAVAAAHRYTPSQPTLPTRSSASSAGYDLYVPFDITLQPGEEGMIWSDVKAYMQPGEVLLVYPRSSLGRRGLRLLNTVGVIDADYYGNPSNDGNIGLMVKNDGSQPLHLDAGSRVAQCIFMPYLLADGDATQGQRRGGFGSSGE